MVQKFKDLISFFEGSSYYYVVIVGTDGKYTYVSPNYNKNFFHADNSLLGQPVHSTIHSDDIDSCIEQGNKCFQFPGQTFPTKLRKITAHGDFIFTQWEFTAMFDEQNNPDGIFCVGHNITEHVDTQSKLLTATSEIETKKEQLEQISYIQSHGIRKPLANIMGLSNIIASIDAGDELNDLNKMLFESASELDSVIKTIAEKTTE